MKTAHVLAILQYRNEKKKAGVYDVDLYKSTTKLSFDLVSDIYYLS